MALGTRENGQAPLCIAASDLPRSPRHPFHARLNQILDAAHFDRFVETQRARFYAPVMGRASLAPGRYVRPLLVGYFEALARFGGKRKKNGADKRRTSPSDPDARITKIKDGRTRLCTKRSMRSTSTRARFWP